MMWGRSFGVLLATVLYTNGIAFGQDAVGASGGGFVTPAYDWLSPARLAWNPLDFNWADLPIKLFITESGGYNTNIYNLTQNQISQGGYLPKGQVNADTFLQTNFGASGKINIEAQQFFVDLTQSTTNYRHDSVEDIHNHSFDAGVNWKAGSHCDGKLVATDSVAQALQAQAIGPGIDNLTTRALSESGQCHFYQNVNVLLSADAISTQHSLITAIPLDNNTKDFQGGLQYQWPSLDNVQALVKYTDTNYTNRTALTIYGGVPQYSHLINYTLAYNNQSSQVFSYSLMGGFTESLDLISATGHTTNGPLEPVYSISLNYQPSAKWVLTLNLSRTVSPPTSIITTSTTQTTTTESATFNYAWTPKVSLSASLALTNSNAPGATATASGNVANNFLYGPSKVLSATLGATYTITPFTSIVLSLNQSRRESTGTGATNAYASGTVNSSIVTIGLDYRPQ